MITKIYNFDKDILFMGSDTMYQQNSVVKEGNLRVETEGMIIPITWHRKENNQLRTAYKFKLLSVEGKRLFFSIVISKP